MKKILFVVCVFAMVSSACHTGQETETENQNAAVSTACQTQQQIAMEIQNGVFHFVFPNFELWTLQDKESRMSANLFPNVDKDLLHALMPTGDTESAINVFLVHKNGQYILFDAGLGSESGGALLNKLSALHLTPADIDVVCVTHCHRDHIGGLVAHDTSVFPKAIVWLSAPELESFREDELFSKILDAYDSRIHTFMFGDTLADFVETFDASGHTPGHTVYKLDELYIIGDLLHAAALQIPYPEYCAIYDKDPEQAVKTRKYFYKILENADYWAVGMHLPYSGMMRNFEVIKSTDGNGKKEN